MKARPILLTKIAIPFDISAAFLYKRHMKLKRIPLVLLLALFPARLPAVPPPPASPPISITLKQGGRAFVKEGRLMLAGAGGRYALAPAGRYGTLEGKVLLVGKEGRLDSATVNALAMAQTRPAASPAPRPVTPPVAGRTKPGPKPRGTPSGTWGIRRQTGTNL